MMILEIVLESSLNHTFADELYATLIDFRDLIAKASLIWAVMNSSTILQHRENMAQYLEHKREQGAFDDPVHVSKGGKGLIGSGRGMVFTAGNADTLRRVVWSLSLIRKRKFLVLRFTVQSQPFVMSCEDSIADIQCPTALD